MCGICGELSYQIQTTKKEHFQSIVNLIKRRGPDDEGIWSDNKNCTLGFRRLAILDLSPRGHQPMLTRDGRFVLVYNGELYNFKTLRAELEQHGIRFQSTGDTEVVLYSLAEWGINALEKFNGMFALGFYDTLKKRLLLARDHAGIKPLYYAVNPQGVVFGSQYNQILQHPWSQEFRVSPSSLSTYLHLGYIPAPEALLENTFMLEAGSWIEFSIDSHQRRGKFFEFAKFVEPTLSGYDAHEAINASINEAVKQQMISDVPMGTFLSGGIDSPLVAAKMQTHTTERVKSFTIGTQYDKFDETQDAIIYAQELDLDYTIQHFTPERALQILDDVIASCGEPFGDYSMFPTMLVAELARKEVTVMLSGDGGDELFWGYPGRFGSVLSVTDQFKQPHWMRKSKYYLQKTFQIGSPHWSSRYFSTIGDWFHAQHTHNYHIHEIFPTLPITSHPLFNYSGFDQNKTAQWLRWNEFNGHLSRVLLKVDRASMYHSLEVRVPLLDKKVIETARQVDWQTCLDIKSFAGKLPLKNALSRHVTHVTKSKRGFTVPIKNWLMGPLRHVVEEKLLHRHDILGFPIDQVNLTRLYKDMLAGRLDWAWGLWILLSLALWEECHFSGRSIDYIRSS